MIRRRLLHALAVASLMPLSPISLAQAQGYPGRPVRIMVPFAAGGGVDILTRALALPLGERLGQPVHIDNRPGAGGNVGVGAAAKAGSDGYTLLMATTGTHAINPGLYKSLPFDPEGGFAPITLVASVPNLLVVNPSLPARDVRELIAYVRSRPGTLSFASFGNGTSNHLSGEMFKTMAGLSVAHVPYKNATQAVTDLIAGQTAFAFVNTPLALPHVRSGKLRALAVTGAKRSAATPDYPTMREAGVPGFVVESWYGLMAPAGTPEAIVDRLGREAQAVLARQDVRDFFAQQGADVETSTPAEFGARIRHERLQWAEVIRTSGAAID